MTERTDDTDSTATGGTDSAESTASDATGESSTGSDPTGEPDPVPTAEAVEPAAPDEFGLVQAWWGDGKGKTTAALGMGLRAAGHGYRVHVVQFMKGGTPTVEGVRGEMNAIAQVPGYTIETTGHLGWHGRLDGSDDDEHAARAAAALDRARDIVAATAAGDPTTPFALDGPPDEGVHMLILDEVLYAVNRGLVSADDLLGLLEDRPEGLELVLTGGHERPDYLDGRADLVSHVEKQAHPLEVGQPARRGTEF